MGAACFRAGWLLNTSLALIRAQGTRRKKQWVVQLSFESWSLHTALSHTAKLGSEKVRGATTGVGGSLRKRWSCPPDRASLHSLSRWKVDQSAVACSARA